MRKDIIVEADYLTAANHSHGPSKEALERVLAAFANAPVPNPDGTSGIQLRIDVGPLFGANTLFSVVGASGVSASYGDFGGGNAIDEAGNEIIDSFENGKGPASRFQDLEAANFDADRELFFRYAIFGHQTNARLAENDCTTGAVDVLQRDLLVTLGGVDSAGFPASRARSVCRWDRPCNRPERSCTTWVIC